MADRTVVYKAIADFSKLSRESRKARDELRALHREETQGNRASARASDEATQATNRQSAANKYAFATEKSKANARKESTRATKDASTAEEKLGTETEKTSSKVRDADRDTRNYSGSLRLLNSVLAPAAAALRRLSDALSGGGGDGSGGGSRGGGGLDKFRESAAKLLNFLPKLLGPLAKLSVALAIGGAVAPAVAALGSLGGAALGVAASLSSLAGAALAVPPSLFALVTGIGAVATAFQGVGEVFKTFAAQEEAVATAAGQSAVEQEAAAQRVVDAQIALADARLNAARAAEDAAERVSDAERAYARAQQGVTDAQQGVNEARQQALEDLRALRAEVENAALSEQEAEAALIQARERYAEMLQDPNATAGDRVQALADIGRAEQNLQDVKKQNVKNAKDLAKAEKAGVSGSDAVVQAKRDLSDAIEAASDAQRGLNRAREDEPRAIRDANRAIVNAELALEQAREQASGATGAAATATQKYQEALDKLSPSARAVVLALIGMKGAWEALQRATQEAFFSNIVDDMGKVRRFLPTLRRLLVQSADAMGEVASKAIDMVTSGPWTKDFRVQARRNGELIRTMGDAGLYVADAFRHLIIAAGPFTQEIAESIKNAAENFRDFVREGRRSGEIEAMLGRVKERLDQWWEILSNVGAALRNLLIASMDFGDSMVGSLEEITQGWADTAAEQRKAGSPLKEYLNDIRPLLSEIGRLIADFSRGFANMASDPKNIQAAIELLKQLRTEVGPALIDLFNELRDSDVLPNLLAALTAIIETITELHEAGFGEFFSGFLLGIQGVAEAIGGVATAIAGLVDGLGELVGLKDAMGGLAKAIGIFVGSFAGLGFAARALGRIARLMKGLPKLGFGKIGLGGLGKLGALGLQVAALKTVFDALNKSVQNLFNKRVEGDLISGLEDFAAHGKASGEAADVFGEDLSTLGEDYERYSRSIQKWTQKAVAWIPGDWADTPMEELEKRAASLDQALAKLSKTSPDDAKTAFDQVMQSAADAGANVEELRRLFPKYSKAIRGTKRAQDDQTDSMDESLEAADALTEGIQANIEAMREKRREANRDIDAELNYQEALDDARKALRENGKTLDKTTEKGRANWRALLDLADAWNDQSEKTKNATGKYKEARQKLIHLAEQMGMSGKAARRFANRILEIPKRRMTRVGLVGTEKWKESIRNLRDFLEEQLGDADVAIAQAAKVARDQNATGTLAQNSGGVVPGPRSLNVDSVPAVLTPGEFVLRKSAVARIGLDTLRKWNAGTYRGYNKGGEVKHPFGIAPQLFGSGGPVLRAPVRSVAAATSSVTNHSVGSIIINNPMRERASESADRTLRRKAFNNGWAV